MIDIDYDYDYDDDIDDDDVDTSPEAREARRAAREQAFEVRRRSRRSRIDDRKTLGVHPTMLHANALDAADEAQEVLWQRLIEYDQVHRGVANYHELRRLLPQWKWEDPPLSQIPAESCQAL